MANPQDKPVLPRANRKQDLAAKAALLAWFDSVGEVPISYESINKLLVALSTESGIAESALRSMVGSMIGSTVDDTLKNLVVHNLKVWLPSLRSGYQWSSSDKKPYKTIPQTVDILDVSYNMEKEAWALDIHVVSGPLTGSSFLITMPFRFCQSLLSSAIGSRALYRAQTIRPYDLSGMRVVAGFEGAPVPRPTVWYDAGSSKKRNKELFTSRTDKCVLNENIACFECGRSTIECVKSRHDYKVHVGVCKACGTENIIVRGDICPTCLNKAAALHMTINPNPTHCQLK